MNSQSFQSRIQELINSTQTQRSIPRSVINSLAVSHQTQNLNALEQSQLEKDKAVSRTQPLPEHKLAMLEQPVGKFEVQNPEEIIISDGSAFDAASMNSRGTHRLRPQDMVMIQKVGFRPGIHQTKDPQPYYNPPPRPRSIFFKGSEFFFNATTGIDKKYYMYKCRDYLCNGQLRFLVNDFYREPKILREHIETCREIMKEKPGFQALQSQQKYNQVVAAEFTKAKGTFESGLSIYQRMLALAREFAKAELCHIYPPHKKQFIRGVREVRRAARGHAAEHANDLIWTVPFYNLLFKCQMLKETVQMFCFGTKESLKKMKSASSISIDQFEIKLPNGKENKECYYSCFLLGPTLFDHTDLCPMIITVYKVQNAGDLHALESLFTFLGMKLYLKNFTQVIVSAELYGQFGHFLQKKLPKTEFQFTPESVDEHLTSLGVQKPFIRQQMRYAGEYRTREMVIERLQKAQLEDEPILFQSEDDKETYFKDIKTVLEYYKTNYDNLLLMGRVTSQNVSTEMPGNQMLLKTKEILQNIAISQILQGADRIVTNPGNEPRIDSCHQNQSLMSEADISHVHQDSQQFTENMQAPDGSQQESMVSKNQDPPEDEEMDEDHEERLQRQLQEQSKDQQHGEDLRDKLKESLRNNIPNFNADQEQEPL